MESYDQIFQERLNLLVAQKLPFLRAVAYRIVNSADDADDAVQGALIRAWKFRWLLCKQESTEGYITRIVIRESYNILRRRAKQQKVMEEYEIPVQHESEMLKKLDRAIARLPDLYRETVHIALLSGIAAEEAARLLKCSTNTMYQRIYKAKALLKIIWRTTKMNEDKLTGLLSAKQHTGMPDFSVPAEKFRQKIAVEIGRRRTNARRIRGIVGMMLVVAAGIFLYQFFLPTATNLPENPARKALAPLAEIKQLFEADVALLMVNDELVTGERLASDTARNSIALKVTDPTTGKIFNLAFAGADNDSLQLESPEWSGDIILSRSDESTLVIDVTLRCKNCKRPIQTIVTIDDKANSNQFDSYYKEVRLT